MCAAQSCSVLKPVNEEPTSTARSQTAGSEDFPSIPATMRLAWAVLSPPRRRIAWTQVGASRPSPPSPQSLTSHSIAELGRKVDNQRAKGSAGNVESSELSETPLAAAIRESCAAAGAATAIRPQHQSPIFIGFTGMFTGLPNDLRISCGPSSRPAHNPAFHSALRARWAERKLAPTPARRLDARVRQHARRSSRAHTPLPGTRALPLRRPSVRPGARPVAPSACSRDE